VTIRVLIVDDHPFVRRGLRDFLEGEPEIEVAGEAADGADAVAMVEDGDPSAAPDVVLMDLLMPGVDGVEATRRILAHRPSTRIVVLTSVPGTDAVVPALAAGASGYVRKDVEPDDLVLAIRAAHRGQTVWPQDVARAVAERMTGAQAAPQISVQDRRRIELLTARELEVLGLLGRGMSNSGIAEQLVVSEKTVKTHVSRILSKLRVDDRTQAAVLAVRAGV
jgi:two-component system, NarL family, response regulator LiaR